MAALHGLLLKFALCLPGVPKMKTPPNQTAIESAPNKRDYTPGTLPIRTNTVTAAVLAGLLESNVLTGLDSVFKQSTTRLSAVIHRLERDYGWTIDRRAFAAGTGDGRVAEVAAYWLPQATIAQAFEAGARQWVDAVNAARALRRRDAEKCRVIAKKRNATRKTGPRQSGLWEGQS